MDKLLASALIGLFAAFITGVIGFAKLVNDKESKTSEFRQEWTASIRSTLSELISQFRFLINLLITSNEISYRCHGLSEDLSNTAENKTSELEALKETLSHNKSFLESIKNESLETTKVMHKNIALAQLHFRHDDPEFSQIESYINSIVQKIDLAKKYIKESNDEDKTDEFLKTMQREIEILCKDITNKIRSILKKEWERIKEGEQNYKKTKKTFKIGSTIMVSVLTFLFLLITIVRYSNYLAEQKYTRFARNEEAAQPSNSHRFAISTFCIDNPPVNLSINQSCAGQSQIPSTAKDEKASDDKTAKEK